MQANDDEKAVALWTRSPGWAGLLRALFVTMRPEQDERPGDPNHKPWRLRWMKVKWGTLDVRTTGNRPFQFGVILMIQHMSGLVCGRCGRPGRIRHAGYVRTETPTPGLVAGRGEIRPRAAQRKHPGRP